MPGSCVVVATWMPLAARPTAAWKPIPLEVPVTSATGRVVGAAAQSHHLDDDRSPRRCRWRVCCRCEGRAVADLGEDAGAGPWPDPLAWTPAAHPKGWDRNASSISAARGSRQALTRSSSAMTRWRPARPACPGRQPGRVALPGSGEGASRPRARARATASARVCVPSLVYRERMWDLTVLDETYSSRAISGAVRFVGR